jgi:glycosyltransferase involved in cell wall biosynthesis
LTPIAPAPTGNGLAMRAALAALGLARAGRLWTAVIPVSDSGIDDARLGWIVERSERAVIVPLPDAATAARGWLESAVARRLVAAAQPLPARARLASPVCGAAALRAMEETCFDAVWALRSYLAGAVVPFLAQQPRPRLILDIDEDDEAVLTAIADLHLARGEDDVADALRAQAAAYGRLTGACLDWFDDIVAASALESRSLAQHYGLARAETVPNAVRRESASMRSARRGREKQTTVKVVFVGNLDYVPNLDALERLATRILPAVRGSLPRAELHVAGAWSAERVGRLATNDGVRLHGFLDDLGPLYRDASLVVVPLRAGGGSRLKILEAFANRVPVVATPAAAAGLEVRSGEHLLIADSDDQLARAAIDLLNDPSLSDRLARRALEYVSVHHDLHTIAGAVAGLVRRG